MFASNELVFVSWEQNGKTNMYHLAHYAEAGSIKTSCGMLVHAGQEPTHATLEKPTGMPCCSVCEGKLKKFSEKYYGGKKFAISSRKKTRHNQKHVGDEMSRAMQSEAAKEPGTLF